MSDTNKTTATAEFTVPMTDENRAFFDSLWEAARQTREHHCAGCEATRTSRAPMDVTTTFRDGTRHTVTVCDECARELFEAMARAAEGGERT